MKENCVDNRILAVKDQVRRILAKVEETAVKAGRLPQDITVMAVTKTVSPNVVNAALSCGLNVIGENRVQEFLDKEPNYELKEKSVHFIGTLQRNKVKYIASKMDMIESVNSLKLAQEIDRHCAVLGRVMPVLIEVNIGNEQSKSGVDTDALGEMLNAVSVLPNIDVKGLMAIPPATDDIVLQHKYCADMYKLFIDIRAKKIHNIHMECLSMGMSSDFVAAIQEGSTQVRLGTILFGSR